MNIIKRNSIYYIFVIILFLLNTGTINAQFIPPDKTHLDSQVQGQDHTLYSVVRSIKAEVLDVKEHHVRISWLPPEDKGEYILTRSSNPISTIDLLLMSELVSVIKGSQSFYLDKNLPRGEYYYAVASKTKVKQKEVFLYADENYTLHPVTISGETGKTQISDQRRAPQQVSLIHAQMVEAGAVRISWKGTSEPNVQYIVYRDTRPLTVSDRIDSAVRLAVISDGTEFFVDRNIAEHGTYYYAVTARSTEGLEDKNLIANQSYTQTGIVFNVIDTSVAKYIYATKSGENSISIKWKDAETSAANRIQYLLYRAANPISGEGDLQHISPIAQIPQGVQSYVDQGLSPGTYYYALVSQDYMGRKSKTFIAAHNATGIPIIIPGDTKRQQIKPGYQPITKPARDDTYEPPLMPAHTPAKEEDFASGNNIFANIRAIPRRDMILIAWRLSKNFQTSQRSTKIRIYRFDRRPMALRDIIEGTMVGRLPLHESIFEDLPLQKGNYYYALFVETPKGLVPNDFIFGENLIGPASFSRSSEEIEPSLEGGKEYNENRQISGRKPQKPKKEYPQKTKPAEEFSSDEINRTIQESYLKADYEDAIFRLSKFEKSNSHEIRAKALFYLGLSHYQLSKYEKALEYMVHPLVVEAYKDRATFWYKRILEHIK
ncbi:MAG: tetratricopeptide repeat protein [Spirochaetia bacterium]|nr:tetratricopeptide repeat protein [Spirochaetia bacterium]